MDKKVEFLKEQLASADNTRHRVDILNELSWEIIFTDEQQSLDYCEQANDLLITRLPNYRKGVVDQKVVLSYHYRQQSRYDEALQLLSNAEQFYNEQQDKYGLLRCYYVFSIIYIQLGSLKLYLEYIMKRLRIAEDLNLDSVVATVHSQLGTFHQQQEEISKSLDHFNRSLEYYLKHEHHKNAGIVLINLSSSYRLAKQFDKALQSVEQAISLIKQETDVEDFAIALGVKGLAYEELGQYDKSLAAHQEKLKLVEQLDSDYMRGYTYTDVGRVMVKTGQIDEGIAWILSAIEISEKYSIQHSLSLAYEAIVEAYEVQSNYQSAFQYQKKLLNIKETIYKLKLEAERTSLIVLHETKQAQLEADLQRERAKQFHSLAENSPDFILRIAHDGTFRYANSTVADVFGLTIDDIIGKKNDDLAITSEFQMLINDILKNVPQFMSSEHGMLRYQTEDLYRTYDVLVVPEFDSGQHISHLLLIGRDITPLKQAEDRLRESERRYRTLFKQSNDGILILSLLEENDVVKVIDANQKFCDMLGYTPDEIQGMKTTDLVVPEERQDSIETSRKVLHEEDIPIHTRRAMTKDGRVITVETTGKLIRDESGKPLYSQSIVRDITERMQIEKALKDSELRYRTLFEQSNDAIFILNHDKQAKILDVNQKACDLLGYSADELRGKRVIDLIVQEEQPLSRKVRAQLRQGDKVPIYERRVIRKDGSIITEEINITTVRDDAGKILYILSIARDITERKQMEEALRKSEARFRALTEKSSDLIITLDSNGAITYVSPQSKTIMPFAQEDLVGKRLSQIPDDFLESETRQYIRRKFEEATQTTLHGSIDFELPLHDADGQKIWLRGTVTNLLEDPDVGTLVVNVNDITELKKALEKEQEESTFVKILLGLSAIQQQNQSQQVLIERILDSLDTIFPNDGTHVMLIENNVAEVVAVSGNLRLYDDLVGHTMNIRDFKTLKTMSITKNPLIITDTRHSDLWKSRSISADVLCYMGTPIIMAGELIGFINLHSTVANQFTEDMLVRLYTIANYVGIVIHNMNVLKREKGLAIHDERQRIARELHDTVSQYLFSSKLIAESLPNLLNSDEIESVEAGVNLLADLAKTALVEMRMLLLELRPDQFTQIPFPNLIRGLVESFKMRMNNVKFETVIDDDDDVDISVDLKMNLYRLIQEALNNIVKHANAQTISLMVRCTQREIYIIIEDDGIGFDMGEVRSDSMGLEIMRERAQQSGITLIMSSTEGKGTCIELHYSDKTQER